MKFFLIPIVLSLIFLFHEDIPQDIMQVLRVLSWVVAGFAAAKLGTFLYRQKRMGLSFLDALEKFFENQLPAPIVQYLKLERKVFTSFIKLVQRSPISRRENSFDLLQGNSYQTLVVLVMIGTCLEIPLLHFLIHFVMDESAFKLGLQVFLALVSGYGAVWFLGDYRRLKEGGIILSRDALLIDLSLHWHGRLAYSNIASVGESDLDLGNPLTDDWRKPKPKLPDDIAVIKMGMNKPNTKIVLTEPETLTRLLGQKVLAREIHFYLEEGVDFQQKLTNRITF